MRKPLSLKLLLIFMGFAIWLGGATAWGAKLSEYETAQTPAVDDVVIGTDVSDTTMSVTGTTKKFRLQDLPISDPVQGALDGKEAEIPGVASDGSEGLSVDGNVLSAGKPVMVQLNTLADLQGYTGPATSVYVRGRVTNGDGGEGTFQYLVGDYSARCTTDTLSGIYVAKSGVSTATGCWIRSYSGRIDIRWFGAIPNNSTIDSTAAINAAIAMSFAIGNSIGNFPGVTIPAGIWYCHEIVWDNFSSLHGEEVGASVLRYNGPGGAGTSLVANNNNTSEWAATPYGGFYNLQFEGFDGTVGHGIAEHGYKMPGAGGTDWGAKFENLHFAMFFGNAIDLTGGGIVNIHMNRMRWDSIGGFCIAMSANQYHEARPVSVAQFTLDNNISDNFATQAAAMGYYDGTHWGKGMLSLTDGNGISVHFSDGRIELNKRLIVQDTRPTMFYVNNPEWHGSTISLENVGGFFQPADAGSVIFAKNGWCNFVGTGNFFYYAGAFYENYLTQTKSIPQSDLPIVIGTANDLFGQGININGNRIEYRSDPPGTGTFSFYKAGDIIFKTGANSYLGWVCTWPTDGFGRAATPSYGSAASISSGSTTVTISSAAVMVNLFVNQYVVITGAGAGGANLTGKIVSMDTTAGSCVLSAAASTTVTNAAITPATPIFARFGAARYDGEMWWNPGSLVNGAGELSAGMTVTGAVLGDFVQVSAPYDLQQVMATGYVSAANTVRIRIVNQSGSTIDFDNGLWKVMISR